MTKILKVLLILSFIALISCSQEKTDSTIKDTVDGEKKFNSTTSDIVELNEKGAGEKFGTITVTETADGISIEVKASGLKSKPGQVGFHLHEKNSPEPTTDANGNLVVGGGLGGHWDPDNTQKHAGPDGDGHRGDLDALNINDDGSINQVVISARIKYGDVKGRSFVIHANPDNYTDEPANGGSGARLYTAIF